MIDTSAKRRSAASFLTFLQLPSPDAVIDAADREQLCWVYRSIVTTPAVIGNFRAPLSKRAAPGATLTFTGGG